MASDGDIDCGSFTRAQLEEAITRIDRKRFPLNYDRLTDALAERLRQERFLSCLPAPSGGLTSHELKFTGNGGEYFRIWIVNLALTIATLGIFSAWAKVRKQRYFHSNTVLDGSAFGYHAEPLKILKGRIIAAALLGAYVLALRVSLAATLVILGLIALITPWLIVKSRAFVSRVTSWRGIRFDFREDYPGAYKTLLGYLLLSVITIGLMFPRFTRERYTFLVSRTSFGDEEFDCGPRIGPFYSTAWLGGALVAGVGIVAAMLAAGAKSLILQRGLSPQVTKVLYLSLPLINYALVGPVLLGFTKARNLNEVLNHTSLGPHRFAGSFDPARLIGIYLTNVLLIVCTAGAFIPWAEVRVARYRCSAIEVKAGSPLDQISATPGRAAPGAASEEISSFFDLDFGF